MKNGHGSDRRGRYHQTSNHAPRGFTLIEVVVAVALLAVVMTMVYGAFSGSLEVTRETAEATERVRQVQLITERLVDELSAAYWFPPGSSPTNREGRGLFRGTPLPEADAEARRDRVAWTTFAHRRYLEDSPQSDISQVEYRLEIDQEADSDGLGTPSGRLVREERVNLLADASWAVETDDVAAGVTEFRLRYLAESEWVDAWDAAQLRRLPRAVEVTVGLAGVGAAPADRIRTVVPLPLAAVR